MALAPRKPLPRSETPSSLACTGYTQKYIYGTTGPDDTGEQCGLPATLSEGGEGGGLVGSYVAPSVDRVHTVLFAVHRGPGCQGGP